jgi:hypothetical protein
MTDVRFAALWGPEPDLGLSPSRANSGHVKTTMLTYVLNRGSWGVRGPIDGPWGRCEGSYARAPGHGLWRHGEMPSQWRDFSDGKISASNFRQCDKACHILQTLLQNLSHTISHAPLNVEASKSIAAADRRT